MMTPSLTPDLTKLERLLEKAKRLGEWKAVPSVEFDHFGIYPDTGSPSSEEVERRADLVPMTAEMARAQADLYTEMKERLEAAEARNATLQALVGEMREGLKKISRARLRSHHCEGLGGVDPMCAWEQDTVEIARAILQKSEAGGK